MYIRGLFEANKHVSQPKQLRVCIPFRRVFWGPKLTSMHQELITETEALLEKWKHPDPYRPPTAPGGTHVELLLFYAILNTSHRLQVRTQPSGANS
jgi:NADH dehydrogenase (ubiquinone) 1 beta subcomplex subunit 9